MENKISEEARRIHNEATNFLKGSFKIKRRLTPEEIKEKHKQYLNTKKGRILKRLKDLRRYSNKKNIIETYTYEEWIIKLERTKGFCPECNNLVGVINLQLDHIFPISKAPKGFIYTIKDIQPLCESCNKKKSAKIFIK